MSVSYFRTKVICLVVLLFLLNQCMGSKEKSSKEKSSKESKEDWRNGELIYVDVDLTLQSGTAGPDVVDAALDTIDLTCIFDNDKLLLRRMAAALTNDGLDEETYLGGAEGGIWNVSESLFSQTQTLPELENFRRAVKNTLDIDWSNLTYNDLSVPLMSALAVKLYLQSISTTIPRTVEEQAELVADELIPDYNNMQTTFVENLEGREEKSCSATTLDIVLVLDGSGSVTSAGFDKVRNFVKQFIDAVDLSRDYTQVGVVQFSKDVHVEFYLFGFHNKEQAKEAVDNIQYLRGGTNTAEALRVTADSMFSTVNGARASYSGVPKIAIVMTDGKSNDKGETAIAAQHLRETGVSVFAVGVGRDVDKSELNTIASDPDCSHVFELEGFDEVLDFVEQIKSSACKEPGQLEMGSDVYATLQAGQKMYSTFIANVNEGVKMDLVTYNGEVKAYLSTKTKNPNSASHQWKCRGNMNDRGLCFIPPGQLKKLAAEGREQIQLYAGFAADDSEVARFYSSITGNGKTVTASTGIMGFVLAISMLFLE